MTTTTVGLREPARTTPHGGRELSPTSLERFRTLRNTGVLTAVVLGGGAAYLASWYSRPIALILIGISLVLCAAVAPPWRFVRTRASGFLLVSLLTSLFFLAVLAVPGFAVLTAVLRGPAFAGVLALTALVTAIQGRRYARAYNAAWAATRGVNESEVLDLRDGTFDVGRGFVPAPLQESASERLLGRLVLPMTPMVPVMAALVKFPNAFGTGVDGRSLVIGVLGPVAAIVLSSMPAYALVNMRRLRGYERQLGRPILNR